MVPKLRPNAPQLRTVEAIAAKHEQIFDALERDAISGKIAEQMGQQLKGIVNLATMEMRFWQLVLKYKRKAPVPRNPILRSQMGLGPVIAPSDGEVIRQLLPDDGR
jgi:hypothetical protein